MINSSLFFFFTVCLQFPLKKEAAVEEVEEEEEVVKIAIITSGKSKTPVCTSQHYMRNNK